MSTSFYLVSVKLPCVAVAAGDSVPSLSVYLSACAVALVCGTCNALTSPSQKESKGVAEATPLLGVRLRTQQARRWSLDVDLLGVR